jgi:serine protease AprX
MSSARTPHRKAVIGLVATTLMIGVASPASAAAVPVKPAADWTFPANATTLADVAKSIRADTAYAQGYTGKGVGVALIDTGVVAVPGLTSGNIVNGPDLSLESQIPSLLHKDGYGHGTHMAAIIAGRDSLDGTGFRGIAPDAKLTSIKVGMSNGAVDVSQMLAAIDWVVQHRNDDPKNPIKVLNLSYGTDSTLGRATNPLSLAVENAWKAGISVVVAAGNTGRDITVPATDYHPISVGANDTVGTTNPADDVAAPFSAMAGRLAQNGRALPVDVMAPGRSIVSLRNPGSYADVTYPTARVGDRYFKGSGTSQAAAVVSGAVALYLQKYPFADPWMVRQALWATPSGVNPATAKSLDLGRMFTSAVPGYAGRSESSTGAGSLQVARGTSVLTFGADQTPLVGERDIFGAFSTATWAAASKAGTSWKGGDWMGRAYTGTGWAATTDGQANWSGRAWSGRAWSGRAWSDIAWSGRAWSGRAWSGTAFSNAGWSSTSWSGAVWP